MEIRKATLSDLAKVAEIYEKIHLEEAAGRTATGWISGVYPVENTARAAIKRDDLFVAVADDTVVGSAILNRVQVDCYSEGAWECPCDDSEIMVMHTLTVDPAHFGAGTGRAFVEFYEQYARENGCKALRLDTNERNTLARAMYKKCGCKEVGIVPCEFNGIPGVHLVLLEKPLIRP